MSERKQAVDLESVPERPRRPDNVVPGGAMQGSGFEDEQFLVQRDGRFIQVTGLLYHIIEAADGQHSLQQIAQEVSGNGGGDVSSDDVRYLIAKNLIPAGLLPSADGTVAKQGDDGKVRSPLKINLQTKVIGPEIINPVTGVLQPLYNPVVVGVVLLASAAVQAWVFFIHGIAPAVHQALYAPALMLPLLLLLILATGWHEIGHATALRYGGGHVRGMGVGFYLVYPAFYTDVTDNYRLGRTARVRTDLGGFYFNLIFALVIVGVYAITRWEFLLLAVLMTDFEIVEQSLPFVRLDGYWALADLTGIPDFFSDIIPFLRTVLPLPFWHGRRLPDLKGWVKAVFTIYIAVAIPVVAVVMFLIVKNVPRVIATAWSSAQTQTVTFSHAHAHGDVLMMVVAAIQLLVLALPAFGSLYAVFNMGRSLASALWAWSENSAPRRLAGSTVMLGLTAFVAYLWVPQLPFGNGGPLRSPSTFQPVSSTESGTVGGALGDVVSSWHPHRMPPPMSGSGGGSVPASRPPAGSQHKSKHPAGAVAKTTASPTARAGATATVTAGPTGVATVTPAAPTAVPTAAAPTAVPTAAVPTITPVP